MTYKTSFYNIRNINPQEYPHNIHTTTGSGVYTQAINECIKNNPEIQYRFFG